MSNRKGEQGETDLVLKDISVPPPLDPAVASISIRPKSNYLNDGYELSLSAYFGSEVVRLSGDDFSTDVRISIERAEVDLEFHNCSFVPLDVEVREYDRTIDEEIILEQQRAKKAGFLVRGRGSSSRTAPLSLEGEAGTSRERELSQTQKTVIRRSRPNWQMRGPNGVIVGVPGIKLAGAEIDDLPAWKVSPKSRHEFSAVIATLRVREDWINLEEIAANSLSGAIGQKARRLFQSDNTKRKKYFGLLLRHLIAIGLQRQIDKEATLAADVILIGPDADTPTNKAKLHKMQSLAIQTGAINELLDSPEGQEIEVLMTLGVNHEVLGDNVDVAASAPQRGQLFLPLTSPVAVLDAYKKTLLIGNDISTADWQRRIGKRRLLTDLVKIGLLKIKENTVQIPGQTIPDPTHKFRNVVAKLPTINLVRAMLVINPDVSPIEICNAITMKFGKEYSNETTKIREGNQLKVWVRWLDPHLIDPEGGSLAKMLRIAAESKTGANVGPSSLATPENIAHVLKRISEGASYAQAARELGLVPQTVYNWKRSGKLD